MGADGGRIACIVGIARKGRSGLYSGKKREVDK